MRNKRGACDRVQMLCPFPVISPHSTARIHSNGSLESSSCRFLTDPTRRFRESTAVHGKANQRTKPKLERKMTGWREKSHNSYDMGSISGLSRSLSITLGAAPTQAKSTLRGFGWESRIPVQMQHTPVGKAQRKKTHRNQHQWGSMSAHARNHCGLLTKDAIFWGGRV